MRGHYTIICYTKHVKEYSIGSHLCTNIVLLKISLRLHLCISNGDR